MGDDGALVLVRHGESTHNASGTFTGRLDVGLTERGRAQAREAARLLAEADLHPDHVVTSPMVRARETTAVVQEALGLRGDRVRESWRLVERDYGFLTDVPKTEALALLGEERYVSLRRTLHGRPGAVDPGLIPAHAWYDADGRPGPDLVDTDDDALAPAGSGESLQDVVDRVAPVWRTLSERCAQGERWVVVAHGNSLRALCAVLDDLTEAEVLDLNLPPAQPLVYRVDRGGRARPRGGRYLDRDTAHRMVALIAHEGGT